MGGRDVPGCSRYYRSVQTPEPPPGKTPLSIEGISNMGVIGVVVYGSYGIGFEIKSVESLLSL